MGFLDNLTGVLGGGEGESGEASGQGGGLMGMIGSMMGQGEGGASSNVVGSLMGGLGQGGAGPGDGSMGSMLQTLAASGLGEHVSSWLSNNPNLPISAQQIHDALGSEQVQQMAQSSGLPVGDFLNQLAQHLPQAASEQAGVNAN